MNVKRRIKEMAPPVQAAAPYFGRSETAANPSDLATIQKINVVAYGLLKLDQDRFQAYWADKEVVLTVTEFGIIRTLMKYPGKVFSRDELMSGAYPGEDIVSDRTIDSHIRRVRLKFSAVGGDPIETVHGLGYKLAPCR
jgi:DNA-binding response OmpR family regulator